MTPEPVTEVAPADELVDTVEAAKILDLTRGQVTYYARTGALEHAWRGKTARGAYLFRRGVVEAFRDRAQ